MATRSLPQPKSPLISAVASSRAAPEYSTSTPHMQKKTRRPEEVKRLARMRATIKNALFQKFLQRYSQDSGPRQHSTGKQGKKRVRRPLGPGAAEALAHHGRLGCSACPGPGLRRRALPSQAGGPCQVPN
ncbi:hypothetical protein HJG60_011835 [Phyllostomus discolor]|uniref:Uncharacterized protein n=1 Tax=Phyllostomus discolor TaxID=89673 RepID=A0A833ZD02_9CHIR|nr:hypothetical protein HJG60_011835 [Phyllostomus discolor]